MSHTGLGGRFRLNADALSDLLVSGIDSGTFVVEGGGGEGASRSSSMSHTGLGLRGGCDDTPDGCAEHVASDGSDAFSLPLA